MSNRIDYSKWDNLQDSDDDNINVANKKVHQFDKGQKIHINKDGWKTDQEMKKEKWQKNWLQAHEMFKAKIEAKKQNK